MKTKFVMTYITAKDTKQALAIARALVTERLAACANILGPIRSIYHWGGQLNDDTEVALIAKTRAALLPKLIARVKQLHTYDCPCIVALPIETGNPDFLDWLAAQTAPPARKSNRRRNPRLAKKKQS